MFDHENIKSQFPIFNRKINGHSLVYLDSAATAQKPLPVIDAISDYYAQHNANVHRGVHTLGDESTLMYQEAREKVARFFQADANELLFVSNTTQALNTVAFSWALQHLHQDDVILVSELEHHSNLVVWQEVCKQTGARIELIKITQDGQIRLDHLESLVHQFKNSLKLVAIVHLSNVTGSLCDVSQVSRIVKSANKQAKVVIDAAQSAPQLAIRFHDWHLDFLAFSGHKLYGPMGTSGLLVKKEILSELKPLFYGGGMIDEVFYQSATFADVPDRYDAGTPDVAGAVGLAAAVQFLDSIGMEQVETHVCKLTEYAVEKLSKINNIQLIGPQPPNRLGSVAFVYQKGHAHDVAQILDSQGIAVRSGHHCAMPLHEKMGWGSTVRASFGVYNSKQDVDRLIEGLEKVRTMLS